jgi:2-hydroxycyclohexanecarboxyl-CoA dehydrogenase
VSRVAIVSGGASGIGLAVCRHLSTGGCQIGVLDIDRLAAERAAAELRAEGGAAVAAVGDVTNRDSVDAAVDAVRATLGPVTILVTSAGISAFEPFPDLTLEMWERVLAVNLTGTFLCAKAVIRDMLDAAWGRIVTISSQAAQSGGVGMAHYTSSKAGVIGLTKALAMEFAGKGITVNTIPPSLIDTPMARRAQATGEFDVSRLAAVVPVGRVGTPDDIAAACAFLASDDAAFITGQVIGVNGGMYV